jgi:hypothetical protein
MSHAQERARALSFKRRMILSPNRSHFGGSCARENGMKEATKRAASEALAHTLAVTAMLFIASFLFYWR